MKKIVVLVMMLMIGLTACDSGSNSGYIDIPSLGNVSGSGDSSDNSDSSDFLDDLLGGSSDKDDTDENSSNTSDSSGLPEEYKNNKSLSVDDCDLSGDREASVKVDVGFDSDYATRDYTAYTNEHGQLTYIVADEIIAQSDWDEDVNSSGRYCSDEAKVEGTESSVLDEGHGIADSLGGTSNAYNITPQTSSVNRTGGEQYDFEEEIRNALYDDKEVTDFLYVIEYPNDSTQIPTGYHVEYYIDGEFFESSFSN